MFNFYTLSKILLCIILCAAFGMTSVTDEPGKPEDNRFTKVVLAQQLEEPIQFELLKDGRVLFAERKGKLKVFEPATGQVKTIAEIPVSTKYVSKTGEITEGEDGLQGVIVDPAFEKNKWIYLYYSPKGGDPKNILTRYTWNDGELDTTSKKTLLEVAVQREECCHVGGGMLFDKAGNLYLSTGDNTFSRSSDGFSPLDERPGEGPRDAQKSSGNTNDLRGKILRIHPEPNGTYTIPEGNLFPKGTPKTRPEIYIMGNRNPWRLTIDSKTNWLYWGEVGPDGSKDEDGRGPRSYDEFNQAKRAGNFGWPYFVGDNKAYWDYDFAAKKSGEKFISANPVNRSPNNTGLPNLPPAQPALVWYPYAVSEEFPELGSGGRSATGGPIYHRADFTKPKRPYPPYYEGKWFVTDWVRGWIMAITIDANGKYQSMERFLPGLSFKGAIDMDFGADGDLYVLEYGNGYFKDNPEAQLVRIEYNGGNRKPIVQASADKTAGAVPFKTRLSAAGTKDYDNDALVYEWKVTAAGQKTQTFKQQSPIVTFTKPGIYQATLTVTDAKGAKNSKLVAITAGNEPPVVKFALQDANQTFFFPGRVVKYAVNVTDKEDGSLTDKKIAPGQVAVSIDYLSEGYDLTEIAQSQRSVDASAQHAGAVKLIGGSDCKACHNMNTVSLGPSFMAVAEKYKGDETAQGRVAKKIISGGSGVWGDGMMPAHSSISDQDANTIVKYILSLGEQKTVKSLPVSGTYTTTAPDSEKNNKGSFIFRAAYSDKGSTSAPAQSAEDIVVLRNPFVPVEAADTTYNMEYNPSGSIATAKGKSSWMLLKKIDLTGIRQVSFDANVLTETIEDALIEIRLGSATGKLIGQTEFTKAEGKTTAGKAAIENHSGFEDIFFVFVNRKAGEKDQFMQLKGVTFHSIP